LEDHPSEPSQAMAPMFWAGAVTPDYFNTLGISTIEGRAFTDADGENAEHVVMVSATTAREFWPGKNPIGKHLRALWEQQWRTVIGVVADVRQFDLSNRTPAWIRGVVYMPYPQSVAWNHQIPLEMALIVRTSENPGKVSAEIRQLVAQVNPDLPVGDVRQLESIVLNSTSDSRSLVWLFAGFAGCALLLAAIGVYGLVSYATAQRTSELGLRLALGATKASLVGLVIRHTLTLVACGLGLGIAASFALTKALSSFLYGVAPTDPITLFGACVILMAVGVLAGYLPARKAANVDPLKALAAD
ncbi:MAG: ABC transporter permease, partial [Blastocatellia bacterium]